MRGRQRGAKLDERVWMMEKKEITDREVSEAGWIIKMESSLQCLTDAISAEKCRLKLASQG